MGVDATHYVANDASRVYLEIDRMAQEGVSVSFQSYTHPQYQQKMGNKSLPWLSHLSVLDLIANVGPDSLAVLRSTRDVDGHGATG